MNNFKKKAAAVLIFLLIPLISFPQSVLAGGVQTVPPPESERPAQTPQEAANRIAADQNTAQPGQVPAAVSPDQDKALQPVDQVKPVGTVTLTGGTKPGSVVVHFNVQDNKTKTDDIQAQGSFDDGKTWGNAIKLSDLKGTQYTYTFDTDPWAKGDKRVFRVKYTDGDGNVTEAVSDVFPEPAGTGTKEPVDQVKPAGTVTLTGGTKPGSVVVHFNVTDNKTKTDDILAQGSFDDGKTWGNTIKLSDLRQSQYTYTFDTDPWAKGGKRVFRVKYTDGDGNVTEAVSDEFSEPAGTGTNKPTDGTPGDGGKKPEQGVTKRDSNGRVIEEPAIGPKGEAWTKVYTYQEGTWRIAVTLDANGKPISAVKEDASGKTQDKTVYGDLVVDASTASAAPHTKNAEILLATHEGKAVYGRLKEEWTYKPEYFQKLSFEQQPSKDGQRMGNVPVSANRKYDDGVEQVYNEFYFSVRGYGPNGELLGKDSFLWSIPLNFSEQWEKMDPKAAHIGFANNFFGAIAGLENTTESPDKWILDDDITRFANVSFGMNEFESGIMLYKDRVLVGQGRVVPGDWRTRPGPEAGDSKETPGGNAQRPGQDAR